MSYTAEIDTINEEQWDGSLKEFDDATIFQTWAYGSARWGKRNLSHAVIKEGGEVIGLAQAVLVGMPLSRRILAYVTFGPVWQRHAATASIDHLRATISALREEYAVRRRLCLRLRPWAYDISADVRKAMLAEGVWKEIKSPYETYILDLARSESELRRAMDKKWRSNLGKAEQCGLTISQEIERNGLRIFVDLSGQMQKRKQFSSEFIGMLPALYEALPQEFKPKIFVCWRGNAPLASAIVSSIGKCAFYLNGASGDAALDVRAGYFLQWAIVRWLKEDGRCRWYDLYGALSSPGVRQFKRGLVGANAPEIPMSEFEACESRLFASVVGAGLRLYEAHRTLRKPLDHLRRRK